LLTCTTSFCSRCDSHNAVGFGVAALLNLARGKPDESLVDSNNACNQSRFLARPRAAKDPQQNSIQNQPHPPQGQGPVKAQSGVQNPGESKYSFV